MSLGHPRFTPSSIQRIRDFNAGGLLTVRRMDFQQSIPLHNNTLLYLDPPYLIKHGLYGKNGDAHKGFDYDGLAELLRTRDGWIFSYNDCQAVHELYKGYIFLYPDWKYGMSKDKESKEVLILSHDIAKKTNLAEA